MNIKDTILGAIQSLREREPSRTLERWGGSTYDGIRRFTPDERGQIGEHVVARTLCSFGCVVKYEPGVTDRYGEKGYDLEVDGIKIEVKLATRGTNVPTFQHENLRKQSGWDALIIIDVAPNDVYVMMTSKRDLPWDAMHRRRESSFYKYDLTLRHHQENGNRVETTQDFYKRFLDLKHQLQSYATG